MEEDLVAAARLVGAKRLVAVFNRQGEYVERKMSEKMASAVSAWATVKSDQYPGYDRMASAAVGNGLSARRTGLDRHEARLALGLLLSAVVGENIGLLRPSTRVPLVRKEGWTTKVRHTAAIAYTAAGPRIVVVLTFRPDEVRPAASRALGGDVNRSLGV